MDRYLIQNLVLKIIFRSVSDLDLSKIAGSGTGLNFSKPFFENQTPRL
jgi:hypothetical protein